MAPVEPLPSRYLPQTLALAPTDMPRVHAAVRHAPVARPGPATRASGFLASLKDWMLTGLVLVALVVDAVLTPRD